jgi:DNA/RNA-binding domain of Phe-tRNA-synthetase-like protein
VLERYPAYACVVVYIDDIDNTGAAETSEALLRQAEQEAIRRFNGGAAASHPHIAAWRAAYQGFGAKPKKHLCSAEALLSRVLRQEPLPSINTVVNLYNTVSIEHVIPIGGEDRDKLTSDLVLTLADGTEPFDTRRSGESVIDHPDAGEVVWKDSTGVTCRRWNWRQCERTGILPGTARGYFVFDCLPPFALTEARTAAQRFIGLIKEFSPGAIAEIDVLHAPAPKE